MKKTLIILISIVLVILGTLAVLPYFFKDEVKASIDQQLAKSVNADVLFDIDNFSLSIFPNFPNITAGIKELGVIGRDEFSGKVLFAVEKISIEINIGRLIFSDQLSIESILVKKPQVFIQVLPSGVANYDIMITNDDPKDETLTAETNEAFNLAIDHWEIKDAHIVYKDATLPIEVELNNLNHTGSGDFSLSVFDLTTSTEVFVNHVIFDKVSYLSEKQVNMDLTLNIDLEQMRFTFADNQIQVNDFSFGFDGGLAMPANDIDINLDFIASDNSFKSFVSLIPVLYTHDFEDLEAAGSFSFGGNIKGVYNESQFPAFGINLGIKDGMFQYPDLPQSIANVQLEMKVENDGGNLNNTKIDINRLHIDFGPNPIDLRLQIGNLINYPMVAELEAALDLKNITQILPVEGLLMEGLLNAKLSADGAYDSLLAIMPKMKGDFTLTDGQIIYSGLPAPLAGINLKAKLENISGRNADFRFAVDQFETVIEGSPISAHFVVENMDDIRWDAEMQGNLNFDKLFPIINQFYRLPGLSLKGTLNTSLSSTGRMSDLEAERYDKLATSGSLEFSNFQYADSVVLPQGLEISSGKLHFGPKQIIIESTKITTGNSDFQISGTVSNYLSYLLEDNNLLYGTLSIKSKFLDLNEFMDVESGTDNEDEPIKAVNEDIEEGVIEVPKNLDFTLMAQLDKIQYQNTELQNARGTIIIKDGILNLQNLRTNMLGGAVTFNGSYNTQNVAKPLFDMNLKINEISIQESYNAITTVKLLAPIAQHLDGDFTTNFNLKGSMKDNMMPDLATLTGGGLLKIAQAVLNNPKIVQGITQFMASSSTPDGKLSFKDIFMTASIQDGKFAVEPFNVTIAGYEANVAGNTGFDGSIDYDIQMAIPAGVIGNQVNSLLGSLTGNISSSEEIKVKFNLGGTYDDPKVNLLSAGTKDMVKKETVNQIVKIVGADNSLADTLQQVDFSKEAMDAEVTRQKQLADSLIQVQKDSLEQAAQAELDSAKNRALNEATKKLNSLFKKKKN